MKDNRYDVIEEVRKFNPFHDLLGRFASAPGGSAPSLGVVHGKDLTGTFQFDTRSKKSPLEQVIEAQGFNGRPKVTDDLVEFDKACKESDFLAKRGISATDQATMDEYNRQFTEGDFYVQCTGGAYHGYGMYCCSVQPSAKNARNAIVDAHVVANTFASQSGVSQIYTFTLDKSAKIGVEYDLVKEMRADKEFMKATQAFAKDEGGKWGYHHAMDPGVYAAYKGYDGYIADGGRNTKGKQSDTTVILNRSKVVLLDESDVPF